jgi:phosphoribosyl-AMP cyclohydrolase
VTGTAPVYIHSIIFKHWPNKNKFIMSTFVFPARTTNAEIELGTTLQPKFGPDGLIPCITSDHVTNEVLMFAYMNAESLTHTLLSGKATYWSRSRNKLWTKGEESGNAQLVKAVLTDCDQDVILLKVENVGGVACHNGYKSCFYRQLAAGAIPDDEASLKLEFAARRVIDPATLYKKK